MPLTYEESAQLMTDPQFRGRVKVACLKYADYLITSTGVLPGGQALKRWGQSVFQSPDSAAMQVQPVVVMDGSVQQYGADINDLNLQSAVETVVAKIT